MKTTFTFSTTSSADTSSIPPKTRARSTQTELPPSPPDINIPPDDRITIYGRRIKNSSPEHWIVIEGKGFVYGGDEYDTFINNHVQSAIDRKWYNRREVVSYRGRYYVSPHEVADKAAFFVDQVHDSYYPIKDKCDLDCRDDDNKKIIVSNDTANNFRQCLETESYFHSENVKTVYLAEGRMRRAFVSHWWLRNNHWDDDRCKYRACAHCGDTYIADLVNWNDDADQYQCVRCTRVREEADAVRKHDDKRFLKPLIKAETRRIHGVAKPYKNPRLYGVECELGFNFTDNRAPVARAIRELLGNDFCYMKHDGSIMHSGMLKTGFEIVTAPCSLDIHRSRWGKIEEYERYKDLRSWDTDTCGMHVHVSREALSALQIGRILVFINHEANKKFVQQVAGRGELKWTKYYPKTLSDSLHPERSGDHDADRRVAVNLQNANTVEFRIFRGTINPRHIIRNIEFVDALCDFCWPASRSFAEIRDYKCFLKFVEQNAKSYPLFSEWARAEKHVRPSKQVPGAKPPVIDELRPKFMQMGEETHPFDGTPAAPKPQPRLR